jgi:hypothetical protein
MDFSPSDGTSSQSAVVIRNVLGAPMLSHEGCIRRLQRVGQFLQEKGWDSLLLVDVRNVYHLEGILVPRGHPVLLWIEPDCHPLVTDSKCSPARAEVVEFESYSTRKVLDHPGEMHSRG